MGLAGDWPGMPWAIPIDFLRASNPSVWTANGGETGPSVAFYIYPDSNTWGYRIAGAEPGEVDWGNPSNSQLLEDNSYSAAAHQHLGFHELVIELELDMHGVNSFTGIWLDGRELVTNTGHNAFNSDNSPASRGCSGRRSETITR